ncbi:MAG: helix-turn-helix domain-containing protein [Ruminococcus sp.]|nr:helix-turn-helix domain-containing protein [Ruminococcus sp.]
MEYKNMFSNYPDVVDVEDLTHMLNIGKNKAYELVNTKAIKSVKVGKKHIIPKYCVIEFLHNVQ